LSLFVEQEQVVADFSVSDNWIVLSPLEQSIKKKIEAVGTPLKDWKDIKIYRGVLTGCNEAFIIDSAKREEILFNCQSDEERERTAELIRPILRGRDIKRYGYVDNGLYLINTHNGIKDKLPRIDIKEYPAIKAHLDQYWDKISTRTDKGDTPYNLRSCAYLEDFSKPKLIYSEIVQEPQFFFDKAGQFYPEATTFIMVGESIEYLYDVLHSRIATYIFKTFYAGGGLGNGGYRYKKAFLELLPIPKPNADFVQYDIEADLAKSYSLSEEEIAYISSQIDIC